MKSLHFFENHPVDFFGHLQCIVQYTLQPYVISFISDLWQVVGFLHVFQILLLIKYDRNDIAEILLKVELNTHTLKL